ncbi:hypothetical protein [Acinetobacter dispersus]|uniref:hypothetical protein n=1 Tax=Acinetobacter dispersus TaxID=70348 RepID=UPI0021CDD77F|nr:hypothetical protein [Acinetobacter dispersus]MCU4337173.1 hypothetical protein [Acinetobacter dispersus]
MKKHPLIVLCIIASMVYSQKSLAKDQCHIQEVIDLSILKKNDYKFYNYICESDLGSYLKGYFGNQTTKVFLGEYSDFAAKSNPELLAVSIYKSKKMKRPLLITLNSAYYCCIPQIEGNMYQVNFYEINPSGKLSVKNVTNIFGEDANGLEGNIEGRVYYNYKTISEIKKWLDKNY